ncbi:UvrD-helicase domain-containing protein [Nakamurella leprariae]|uniref:RecBCD enzyme subunit RecB n=1 Tax=Nakamurella leprariae TaxID=2803911 RepID=A0A938YAZ9_9ACTN|nr:UvrD-helicase domain-containing protein [Nakamurella leprariae]MBM9467297.1 UvrD-helicase domain-containing protein [Nakamurella leprariae]
MTAAPTRPGTTDGAPAVEDRAPTPEPFSLTGPLPVGTTVLEASAGTGKTHTVGALVTRFVAERGVPLDQLLVVTFGRAASQELRERVRAHLVGAEQALADPAAARAGTDVVVAALADVPDAEVAVRRRRLAAALADFDAATIATTHQFCQQVLTGLGAAGDSDPAVELVEDLDDLVVQVVDDLYVRAYGARTAGRPEFSRSEALALARAAVADPHARIEPVTAASGTVAARRVRFATVVREELDRRKRAAGVVGFDDLLSRVADALAAADAPARDRMRARWSVVLVDEFQDTDPVQWLVLDRAFSGHATVVLIGDPKQAIYAFRGGDVTTYLAAARTASRRATLAENHRSDAPLVDALQVLLGGAALGDPEIRVRPVRAARAGSRLAGSPSPAPVRLRRLERDTSDRRSGALRMDQVRPRIAADLAADVGRLLASGATFDGRPLVAGDVAVLVHKHDLARLVQQSLDGAGIPAVVAAAGSVYATVACDDWLTLLEAMEQPHRAGRVHAAALTAFFGRSAADLDTGGDELTDRLGSWVRGWAAVLAERGVAAVLEAAVVEQHLARRLLGRENGERLLTDLRHIAQNLHAAAVQDGLGLVALLEWLRRRRDEAATDTSGERTRRLDSDAAAVQVITLHASKGLQYPVVYLPFAFDRYVPDREKLSVLRLHDDAGHRVLDVGGPNTDGWTGRADRMAVEEAGESLRLFYVGATRAQSQLVLWWAPATNARCASLHRVLFGRDPDRRDLPDSGVVPDQVPVPHDEDAGGRLRRWAEAGAFALETVGDVVPVETPPPAAPVGSLTARPFHRRLDLAWRRSSYSSLAAAAADAGTGAGAVETAGGSDGVAAGAGPGSVGSEPERGERDDEDLGAFAPPGSEDPFTGTGTGDGRARGSGSDRPGADLPSPMADLPMGAAFGTVVHAVFEEIDPTDGDLLPRLREVSATAVARRPVGVHPDALAEALLPTLLTPLGPLADDRRLADIGGRDRLCELDFEMPLAGGDRPRGPVVVGDLAPIVRRHLAADDPLAGYADRLADPALGAQPMRGFLTGSLDLVVRLPGPRYVVADYKTNWLSDPDADTGSPTAPRLSAWHYRPEAMTAAMLHSDYPLQALIYSVALHRFLRWRQPGYRPEQHLGGVLYLFVRGMCGPDTPRADGTPHGVFGWRPPSAMVVELSDALDGAATGPPSGGSAVTGSPEPAGQQSSGDARGADAAGLW